METILSMNETDLWLDNGTVNSSLNSTAEDMSWSSITLMCLSSIFLTFIILSTVIGNVLVILAVFIDKNLQNVANRLIVSLAFADLMVSVMVMPPAAIYMISGSWHFGAVGCDLWTSADVLGCSASILHLLAVALERFLCVSRINWTVNRNKKHINIIITFVWLVAGLVSVAPLLGWKDPHFLERIQEQRCMVSPERSYQLFATISTFYAPTVLILILYWKIWQTAKNRIRHRVGKTNNHKLPTSTSTTTIGPAKIAVSSTFSADELSCHTATVETSTESVALSPIATEERKMEQMQPPAIIYDEESGVNPSIGISETQLTLKPPCSPLRASQASLSSPENEPSTSNQVHNSGVRDLQKRKETLEAKRERKAAKTLAVITGAFMACWLPFFVQVLVMAICEECTLPDEVMNAFQWLGYINSTLNPIIYTLFSPDFRLAFKKILCGKAKSRF